MPGRRPLLHLAHFPATMVGIWGPRSRQPQLLVAVYPSGDSRMFKPTTSWPERRATGELFGRLLAEAMKEVESPHFNLLRVSGLGSRSDQTCSLPLKWSSVSKSNQTCSLPLRWPSQQVKTKTKKLTNSGTDSNTAKLTKPHGVSSRLCCSAPWRQWRKYFQ